MFVYVSHMTAYSPFLGGTHQAHCAPHLKQLVEEADEARRETQNYLGIVKGR